MSRRAPTPVWEDVLPEVRRTAEAGDPVAALARLVDALRPADASAPAGRVASLSAWLETRDRRSTHGRFLGELVLRVVAEARCVHTLTDAGIPSGNVGFWSEFVARLGRRLLPDVEDPRELSTVLSHVFRRTDDHVWVARVSVQAWTRLMNTLGLRPETADGLHPDLSSAIRVLAHHVASLGLQPEITERLPHLEGPASPFVDISSTVLRYLESYDNEVVGDEALLLDEALEGLEGCREAVETLRAEKDAFGTSLGLTTLSFRLLVQVDRLTHLLHLTEPVERDFHGSAVALLRSLVRAVNTRNQIVPHVRESADLLAYQVVEFAARKGSKYIANSPREYFGFFLSSLGGGLIVAVFGLLKLLLDKLEVSLAAEAFLFGINYSICFVLIYLTGATLATKQPSMTANTLARTLGGIVDHDLRALEELVVRVWRSQFISFVGNLAMAFPLAVLLSWLYRAAVGAPIADGYKAGSLLQGLHPWQSGALLFAGVAGFFLFAAGLVSGWVDNRNRFSRIPARVAAHPALRRSLGPERSARLAKAVEYDFGIVAGNVFLGFCLGSTGTIGQILGVPIDIRHIAFASAHFGAGLESLGWVVPLSTVAVLALGVAMIGLVNFLVSFGLSLALAMESRRVTFHETGLLVRGLLMHFLRRPLEFFFPPRSGGKGTVPRTAA